MPLTATCWRVSKLPRPPTSTKFLARRTSKLREKHLATWKKSHPRHKPFNCCAAWHLRNSGLYLAVYDLIGGITAGGKTPFFSSVKHVAIYFDADYETVRRVFKGLRKMGFLDLNEDGKYLYIPHDKFVSAFPGKCNVRELLPWQSETDPLVGKMYGAAGGKLRLMEGKVIMLRKYMEQAGLSDEVVLAFFVKTLEFAAESRKRGDYKRTSAYACFQHVLERAREKAKQSAEVPETVET